MKQLAIALLLSVWSGLSLAQSFDPTLNQRQEMAATVETFATAFQEKDFLTVFSTVPVGIIEHISEMAGMEPGVLAQTMANQMGQAMQSVEILDVNFDTDGAQWSETSEGRAYALVPTAFSLKLLTTGQIIDTDTHTLAFADAGTWYLVRVEEAQQIAVLTTVYPEFQGVTFPSGSSRARE